jgi:hypothetical protein
MITQQQARAHDLAIKTAWTQKCGVKSILPVGSHDDLHVDRLVETIHLSEQLEQNALHLPVRARLRVESLGCNGVNLVDEDNGGRVVASKPEHIPHHPRPFSQILLHKL